MNYWDFGEKKKAEAKPAPSEPKPRIEKVWMNAETAKAQREYERAKRRAC